MKPTRVENQDLLGFIKSLPCISCQTESVDICPHHVRTKGAGGHDIPENLMPLCKQCHVLIHQLGTSAMARVRPNVKKWLILADWEYDSKRDKWAFFGKDETD